MKHWYETFDHHLKVDPYLTFISDSEGVPLALLPLGIRTRSGCRVLGFLGAEMADFHAPILHRSLSAALETTSWSQCWQQVVGRLPAFDAMVLEKMPQLVDDQPNPLFGLPGTRSCESNLYCTLDDSFDHFCRNHLSAKFRSDTRRRLKRLEEAGTVSFEVARSAESASAVTEKVMELKSRRYRETGAFDLFALLPYRRFLLGAVHGLPGKEGLLHISALSLDGTIIAAHWGLHWRGHFYHFLPGAEAGAWKPYAPGRLHLLRLFEWCHEHRARVFDFTIGDEPYKKDWATARLELARLVAPFSPRGHFYCALERVKDRIRSRPLLHRMIGRLRNTRISRR
jgi:CelD/BcsL family acetyltransferase involved in cellulose biosynthesis